jgi:hypothetical protein
MSKLKLIRRDKGGATKVSAKEARTGAKAEKGKAKGAAPVARYTGRTSGLSVTQFQNQSIESNRKRKLTDEQLAKEWRNEFPNAKADYTAETVRGVRNLYNKGNHSNDEPTSPVPEFNDAGEALAFWGEKAAAKRAAGKAPKAEQMPAKPAKGAIKKLKKTKR